MPTAAVHKTPRAESEAGPGVYEHAYRRPGHPGQTRWACALMAWLGRCLGRLMYIVRVEGLEHFPASGPLLVLVKHQRNSDIPLGFAHVLTARRPDNWCIMKHDLAGPQFGGFVLQAGGIPIDRERPMRSRRYFRLGREVLHAGRALVLFPEQTFFVNCMGPGKFPGFRYLTKAATADLPVISVGLDYRPRGWFRRTEAVFRMGPPRVLPAAQTTRQADLAEFLHERMQAIAELTGSGLEYTHAPASRARRA